MQQMGMVCHVCIIIAFHRCPRVCVVVVVVAVRAVCVCVGITTITVVIAMVIISGCVVVVTINIIVVDIGRAVAHRSHWMIRSGSCGRFSFVVVAVYMTGDMRWGYSCRRRGRW